MSTKRHFRTTAFHKINGLLTEALALSLPASSCNPLSPKPPRYHEPGHFPLQEQSPQKVIGAIKALN